MGRRAVSALVSMLAVLSLALSAGAQTRSAVPRVGLLSPSSAAAAARQIEAFRQGLREQGYVDGSSITIEYRFAAGRFDRLPALARELVGLHVDVLVAAVTQASLAAQGATSTIPIVMVGVADPVAARLVASLSRPGGNVTGNSSISAETAGKSLELLREVVPGVRRVAVLWNPANRAFQAQMLQKTEAAARSAGVQLVMVEGSDAGAIDAAVERVSRERVGGMIVLPDPTLAAHARLIAALAARHHLPTVSGDLAYAEAGGLMAYGPNFLDLYRSAATYVARILRGAKPADLPVEQPTKFYLLISRHAAGRLGLTLPQSLLVRADRLVE
jgi:putative ABC transport system substrate-binding protein